MSVNHTERFVVRLGHTVQRIAFDYGYDLFLQTFDADGVVERGYALLQLKATDAITKIENGNFISIPIERRDLQSWFENTSPVFLVVYDAFADQGFWCLIQEQEIRRLLGGNAANISVRIPTVNTVDDVAVLEWRRIKNGVALRSFREDQNDENS